MPIVSFEMFSFVEGDQTLISALGVQYVVKLLGVQSDLLLSYRSEMHEVAHFQCNKTT